MKNKIAENNSTLQEWSNFLNVLNAKKNSDKPLLVRDSSPVQIVFHLEKHFLKDVA